MPKFSIITVCLNAKHDFCATAQSILDQTISDYSYVVIDGQSTDGTIESAYKFREKFQAKGISCIIVSEKDTGIYNAMNKAIQLADGDWLLFLNAGDTFCASDVLQSVANYIDKDSHSPAVVYGSYVESVVLNDGIYYRNGKNLPITNINIRTPICHQSAFIKADVMRRFGYDERYKIGADYDFFLRCYESNLEFYNIPVYVCCFSLEGISSKPFISNRENILIRLDHGLITNEQYKEYALLIERQAKRYWFLKSLFQHLPKKIRDYFRRSRYVKRGFKRNRSIEVK